MSASNPNVLLANVSRETVAKFKQLNKEASNDFGEIIEKLEFCIGSFNHDQNPVGLLTYVRKALKLLKEIKAKKPRKVSKKLIDDLESTLQLFA